MRKFLKEGNENKIFYKMYLLMCQYKSDLSMKTFLLDVLSFHFVYEKKSEYYNTARRYLLGSWDEKGKRIKEKYDFVATKLKKSTDIVLTDKITFELAYKNNSVVEIIGSSRNYQSVIEIVRQAISLNQIDEFSLTDIRYYEKKRDPKMFLLAVVCGIFGISPQKSRSEDEIYIGNLSELLSKNGQKIKHLYQYSKNTLFKVGQSSTYGVLETLYHAGFPENINRECDPFTLLDAADIYYYHKLKWGNKDQYNLDIEYSYRYSKVAFEEYQSPQAAWNMGYIWQTQGRQKSDKEYRFEIDDFKSIVQTEENYLNIALDYFIFAAKHDYSEAYTSIGNICYKLLKEKKNFYSVSAKIISFTSELINKKDNNRVFDLSKRRKYLEEAEEICYMNAAKRYSVAGMSNYYKLLIKKLMMARTSVPLRTFMAENKETINEISKYLSVLCEYRLPSALIDAAGIALHKHHINEWLHDNKFTINNQAISESTNYNFILDYYQNIPDGKEMVNSLLEKAIENEIPSLQVAGAFYYLSVICFEEMKYHEADEYIKKAIEIYGMPSAQKRSEKELKRIHMQAQKCSKALENGYYFE